MCTHCTILISAIKKGPRVHAFSSAVAIDLRSTIKLNYDVNSTSSAIVNLIPSSAKFSNA